MSEGALGNKNTNNKVDELYKILLEIRFEERELFNMPVCEMSTQQIQELLDES